MFDAWHVDITLKLSPLDCEYVLRIYYKITEICASCSQCVEKKSIEFLSRYFHHLFLSLNIDADR